MMLYRIVESAATPSGDSKDLQVLEQRQWVGQLQNVQIPK
jgi:hypothetical protein